MLTRLTAADRRLSGWVPTTRIRLAIAALFGVSLTLQVVGVPFTSSFGTRTRIDLDVYRIGAQIWQEGQSLYADGSMPFTSDGIWLPFTYPPFAALTFVPLGAMELLAAGIVMSLLSAALLVLILHIVLTVLSVGSQPSRWWLAVLLAAGGLWLSPVWMTLGFGQINLILMAMILVDVFVLRGSGRKAAGVLTGLASAIKLTPLVFIALFAAAGRWKAAIAAGVTFMIAGIVGWVWLPQDSLQYWTYTLFHTGRIGEPAGRINQNINAMGIRLLPDDATVEHVVWVLGSLAVTALAGAALLACRPTRAFATDASPDERVSALLATSVIAVWGLLVSPTSWGHHWVWVIPLILAATVVAARSTDSRVGTAHAVLAVSGLIIFALGPFQLMSAAVRQWSLAEHVIGNAYTLWGFAALIILWRFPFRGAQAQPSTPAGAPVNSTTARHRPARTRTRSTRLGPVPSGSMKALRESSETA